MEGQERRDVEQTILQPPKKPPFVPKAVAGRTQLIPGTFPQCPHKNEQMTFFGSAPYGELVDAYRNGCSIRIIGVLTIDLRDTKLPSGGSASADEAIAVLAKEVGEKGTIRLSDIAGERADSRDTQPAAAVSFQETRTSIARAPNRLIASMETTIGPDTMEEAVQGMAEPVTVLKLAHRLQAMTRVAITQTQQRARVAEEALGLPPGKETQFRALSNTGIMALVPAEDEKNRRFEGMFSIVPPPGSAASDRFSLSVENQVDIRGATVEVLFNARRYDTSRESVRHLTVLAENEKFRGKAVHLTYVLDPKAQRFVQRQSQTRTPTLAHPRTPSTGEVRGGSGGASYQDAGGGVVEVCPACALAAARKFLMEQNAALYAEEELSEMDASHADWQYYPWYALVQMEVREL